MRADEETTLNNFKAHRAKILDELKIAGSALTEVLSQIEVAGVSLSTITNKQREAEATLASLAVKTEAKKKEYDGYIVKIADAKNEWVRLGSAHESRILDRQAEVNSLDALIAARKKELDTVSKEKETVSLDLDLLTIDRGLLEDEIKEDRENHRIWKAATDDEQATAKYELEEARKARIAEDELLLKTRADIAEEIKKIEEPQKALAADYAKIAHMKRNVDIYAARVKRKHKELYPGRPFNII